jgi:hypothetical protein
MRVAIVPAAILVMSLLVPARGATAAYVQTTFQIGGMVTDIPADTTLLVRIDDAGLDWVFWYGWHYATLPGAAEVVARLESLHAHRAGFALKALACYKEEPGNPPPPPSPGRLFWNRERSLSRALIDSTLSPSHGISGPSTLGYTVWDEPDTNEALAFTNIGLISRWIAANPNSSDKLAYTNLFSACFMPDSTYAAYLKRYLDLFDGGGTPPPVLSFDEYPFQVPTRIEPNWFRTLRLVRDATNAQGRAGQRVPWQPMIELSPFHYPADSAFSPMSSVVNTRWQAYTALAYGAKGLCYFQLGPASSTREVWGDGILRANGDTVATRYSEIRALDSDLHHLGPWLMRLDPVATFRPDTLYWAGVAGERVPGPAPGVVSRFGAGSDSTLAGHLKDRTNGDDYLMVVSLALVAKQTFALTLASAADSLFQIQRATGGQRLLGTRTSTVRLKNLPPGQGELFRIVR